MTFQERIKLLWPFILGVVFTLGSLLVGKLIDPKITATELELAAVFTSYVCVILCVTQKRSNYFWGIISTFLYCLLFWQSKLFALSVFNGVLVLSLIYGWFRWGPDGRPLQVTDVKLNAYPLYALFGAVVMLVMFIIFQMLGEPLNHLDIITAVLSAVAQLMLDNKKRQTWVVWAVVNVMSLFLFYHQGIMLVFVQYIFFLINTMMGWFMWSRTMQKPSEQLAI